MTSTPAPHRIRRQRWLVRTACAPDAFAARAALRAAWDDALLPAIERALDRACATHTAAGGDVDVVVRLPRLEVSVRVDDVAALDGEFPSLLEGALVAQLARLLGADASNDPASRADRTRVAAGSAAALLHYLRTGALPWDAHPTAYDGGVDGTRASLRAACVREAARVASALVDWGAPAPVLFRLLALLDTSSAGPVADALAARVRPERVDAVRAAVARSADHTAPRDRGARSAVDTMETESGRHARVGTGARLIAEACDAATPQHERAPRTARGTTSGLPVDAPPDLPVSLAGLVLLHPFLPAFLRTLGVDPASTDDRARAAALLHHVATGRLEVDEWELPLVKVLVGLTPDDPLPVAAGLVCDRDVAEADALLGAVVTHWRAVGRTSPAGLRAGFLDRGGLLGRVSDAWRLRVEPAAHDLLLGALPWPLSLVKLPWMPAPLHVEWTPP